MGVLVLQGHKGGKAGSTASAYSTECEDSDALWVTDAGTDLTAEGSSTSLATSHAGACPLARLHTVPLA